MDWGLRTNRRAVAGLWWACTWASAAAGANPAAQLRPVPEYAPTKAVLVSADLFAADYHAPELISAIAEAGAQVWLATNAAQTSAELAAALHTQGVSAAASAKVRSALLPHGNIWMRDYAPFMALDGAGQLRLFDLIYADAASKLNDRMPLALGQALQLQVSAVPLELDGGNFLTNGDFCFTSSIDLPISKEGVLGRYLAQIGCRQTVVITASPHAHLDMWAKIVNDHQVLVNELDDRALALATRIYGHLPPELKDLRDSLNQKAAELSRYLQVKRLPMPLPYRGAFRTFSNSILINGRAIVPSYRRYGWNYDDYPDASLEPYYEERVRQVYRSVGYRTRLINADGLIYNGGAFHCVTAQIPKLPRASIDLQDGSTQRRKGH